MKTLLEIGEVWKVESYIKEALAQKKKIMGFGHAVYRTEDPRATHLRRFSKEVGERAGDTRWHDISRKVEEVVMREKGLTRTLISILLVYYMWAARSNSTLPFAISRISGGPPHP